LKPAITRLARTFRAESGQVLASLVWYCKDLTLAEDALQDACEQATIRWPAEGIPDNAGAWLHTVAKRRLIDHLRQNQSRSAKQTLQLIRDSVYDESASTEAGHAVPDERLRLIFTCCHPALNERTRVALTLKTLCGLKVKEIARAFLSSEVAMSQRLTRAKRKIRDAGIAYEIPEGAALEQRLPSVLAVIYLIYNESYSAYEGQTLTRSDLANEAIRLARILCELIPRPDVSGLLALMLLHDSRRSVRSAEDHSFVPLQDQDRSAWNQEYIAEGTQILLTALAQGQPERYQIQASISALHATAKSWSETDWSQIEKLYGELYKVDPSDIVLLNASLAKAHAGDLDEAYRKVLDLQTSLNKYQPYHAAKADLETRLGLAERAAESYDKAIGLTRNRIERDFLIKKRNS